MIGYEGLKRLAREMGCRVSDLLAQAPANDPFYAEVPARAEAAEWFAKQWQDFGWQAGVHLRRIHYRLVSAEVPILRPDGSPYLNFDRHWQWLVSSSLAARYLGLIPADVLVDRRNPDPIINAAEDPGDQPGVSVVGGSPDFSWSLDEELTLPGLLARGFRARQPYLVEVWIEKSTLNDILAPLATRLGFNLVPGIGETSEIQVRLAVERAVRAERPMRVLYISDFDPGGRSMPVAFARKLEFALASRGLDLDITAQPIALTPEQCRTYRLPRTPLKESERRAAKFEARFGEGATELDALEALHPGELARIVEAEVCRYIDPELPKKVSAAEREFQHKLEEIEEEVHDRYDLGRLVERYDAIRSALLRLEEDAAATWEHVATELHEAAPSVGLSTLPQPRPATPDPDPLFDSRRPYLDQLDRYRRWQGRDQEEVA